VRRSDAFVTEPQCDHGDVQAGLQKVHGVVSESNRA
jgi:hypothetical protein